MFWISFPQRQGELRHDFGILPMVNPQDSCAFLECNPGAKGTVIAGLYPVLKCQILFSVAEISQPNRLQAVKNGALNSERGVQMKKFLLGSVAAAALGMPAMAADMGVAPRSVAPTYDWSGIYVGGNAGWMRGTASSGFNAFPCVVSTVGGTAVGGCGDYFTFGQGSAINIANVNAIGSNSSRTHSFTGGGQIGFNLQKGRFVGGMEWDFESFRPNSSTLAVGSYGPTAGSANNSFIFAENTGGSWLSTLRGRIGVAPSTAPNSLFYLTAGLAAAKVNFSGAFTDFQTAPPRVSGGLTDFQSFSQVQYGFVGGAGLEYGIGNWSVRAEYLYLQLAAANRDFAVPTNGAGPGTCSNFCSIFQYSPTYTQHILRVGVNYRFGGALASAR
jgi:outer membrane immunogenic protein